MADEFISVTELARRAGVTRPTMLKMVRSNKGPKYFRLPSGQVRIKRTDGELWLNLLQQADEAVRRLLGW